MKQNVALDSSRSRYGRCPRRSRRRRQRHAKRGDADETFVTKAAQGGMAEVELGKLAPTKASSDK